MGEEIEGQIDLKKVSGIQFDPEAKEMTSRVIDELDYLRGLINHLWDWADREEAKTKNQGEFGVSLVFSWIDNRIIALRKHIDSVLREGRTS